METKSWKNSRVKIHNQGELTQMKKINENKKKTWVGSTSSSFDRETARVADVASSSISNNNRDEQSLYKSSNRTATTTAEIGQQPRFETWQHAATRTRFGGYKKQQRHLNQRRIQVVLVKKSS